ncbi:MAG: hypothetical protein HN576_14265 [Bacteriovoracaceae bacterium]|nr:hypothetical protein [Bacteriovoracaceae bacterium]
MGNTYLVNYLLSKGASPNRDKFGHNPLNTAYLFEDYEKKWLDSKRLDLKYKKYCIFH